MIFWAMIGYPFSILFLEKVLKPKKNHTIKNLELSVTVMIVAHNEEKVIEEKLLNVIKLNYPMEKLEIIVSSDNSTDNTNKIVEKFIDDHKEFNIRLYKVKKRMGKTNAQNEAQKLVSSDILVMTDANAMLHSDSIMKLVSSFSSEQIAYVCGMLKYTNEMESASSEAESTYWNIDIKVRDIESRLQTITAGNGALYAVRNKDYIDFNPIESHDSAMPTYYNLNKKRALMNPEALAFEKAGETIGDEFSRKVRMNRNILKYIIPKRDIFNIRKYKWFSYFFFGHRTCRYLLWFNHLLLFLSNIALINENYLFFLTFVMHLLILIINLIVHYSNTENKILKFVYYYSMTVLAQWNGVINIMTGKAKPFWEKAESTR